MSNLLREAGVFLWAFISHWQSYATGGVLTGIINVVERLSSKSLPRRMYLYIFVVSFSLVAFFMTWRDQYKQTEALRTQLSQKSAPQPIIQVNVPPAQIVFQSDPTNTKDPASVQKRKMTGRSTPDVRRLEPKSIQHSPIKITSYEVLPYVVGRPPEVHMHIWNASEKPVEGAQQYDPYTVRNPVSGFLDRSDLENKLWARFEAGLELITSRRNLLTLPSKQDVWLDMRGLDPITQQDIDGKTDELEFYFLSRLFDSHGEVLADSCVFFKASSPKSLYFCVKHN